MGKGTLMGTCMRSERRSCDLHNKPKNITFGPETDELHLFCEFNQIKHISVVSSLCFGAIVTDFFHR